MDERGLTSSEPADTKAEEPLSTPIAKTPAPVKRYSKEMRLQVQEACAKYYPPPLKAKPGSAFAQVIALWDQLTDKQKHALQFGKYEKPVHAEPATKQPDDKNGK